MKGLHLYETDMHKIALILIIISLLFVSSCKDDDETEPVWDPSGLYNVSIRVKHHSPNIQYIENEPPRFRHQLIQGFMFDTLQQQKCCRGRLDNHDCATDYEIINMRIFESYGQYYLYGAENFSTDSVQTSFHLPLQFDGQRIFLDSAVVLKNLIYMPSYRDNMFSSALQWPLPFHFIEFELKQQNNTVRGTWIARETSNLCSTTMSDGSNQYYHTTEFADITFTRIGD